ncbi:hypothetical protein LOTGIDRAFT_158785 [Lottia gigantea]|uniref:Protein kinase domain-containing protein n=1 Tax=Lottia gigantea TaxID=225164 RepID=V4AV59_LOTGI|nr:hypothetical protein LOTGIDRAFT_158785 [Lottia gigantea]ESO98835.1 hypothetical protein LOTGIDRAFT_158785 [Lottia gigantea]
MDLIFLALSVLFISNANAYKITGLCHKPQLNPRPKEHGYCTPDDKHIFKKYGYKDDGIPADLSGFQPHLLHESSIVRYFDELGKWKFLASGSYADVYEGEMAETGVKIVIKQYDDSSEFQDVNMECRLLMYLSETGLFPKCYGLLVSSNELAIISIILEHVTGTENLRDALHRKDISVYQWTLILEQVARYLKLLHSKYVLHNDVNRGNILIKWNGSKPRVHMIDPGMATFRHGKYSSKPTDANRVYTFFDPTSEYFESDPANEIHGFGYLLLRLNEMHPNEDWNILRQWCRKPNRDDRPTTDELIHRLQSLQIKYRKLENDLYYKNTFNETKEVIRKQFMTVPIPVIDVFKLNPFPDVHGNIRFISYSTDHMSYKANYNGSLVMVHLFVGKNSFKSSRNEALINMFAEPFGLVPKFIGLCFYNNELDDVVLVQEFLQTLTTLDIAISNHSDKWTLKDRSLIACEISKSVLFFHDNNILINGINPGNILLKMDGGYPVIKWSDLGEWSDGAGFRLKDTGICNKYNFGLTPKRVNTCVPDDKNVNVFKKYGYKDDGIPADLSGYQPYLLHESSVVRYFDLHGEWEYLSNGTFAMVYTGEMRVSKEKVVIKQFTLQTDIWEIEQECKILMYLADTGFFPKFYGYMPSGPSLYNLTIILEHLTNTEGIAVTSERPEVSMYQWCLIFEQFLRALKVMHKKYVLHNDLHRENILIKWNGSVPKLYLIDTGFSTFREGTYQYMSSATLNRYPFFPQESVNFESNPSMDVYGFGYVVNKVNNHVLSEDLKIIADWCAQKYPEDRPTTDELLDRFKALKLKYKNVGSGYTNSMSGVLPKNAHQLPFLTKPIPILLLVDITPMPSISDTSEWLAIDEQHGSYKGVYRNKSVVIRLYSNRKFAQIRHEAAINLFFNSTGLVPLFYGMVFYDTSMRDTAIVQEYVVNSTSLAKAIERSNLNWTDVYRKCIACNILKSIEIFHKEHILINNIQSSNILYINNGTSPSVKFINLHDHSDTSGLLRDEDSEIPIYAAPETVQNTSTSYFSDIYSTCFIFKELFNPSECTIINEVINYCLTSKPKSRPSVKTLMALLCHTRDT